MNKNKFYKGCLDNTCELLSQANKFLERGDGVKIAEVYLLTAIAQNSSIIADRLTDIALHLKEED